MASLALLLFYAPFHAISAFFVNLFERMRQRVAASAHIATPAAVATSSFKHNANI
jgi:hypothetical protein